LEGVTEVESVAAAVVEPDGELASDALGDIVPLDDIERVPVPLVLGVTARLTLGVPVLVGELAAETEATADAAEDAATDDDGDAGLVAVEDFVGGAGVPVGDAEAATLFNVYVAFTQ
jgi:hypothetical protein